MAQAKPEFRAALPITVEALNAALEKTGWAKGVWKSCLSCDHFTEANEQCGLYKARPPARVIAFACPSYSDDQDVPF